MIEFLLVAVIIISLVLLGLLIFIWIQINSTNSKLIRIIENRIRLNNVLYELDRLEFPIIEETTDEY